MGVELFGILVLVVIAVGAFFLFTGAFGVAKKAEGGRDRSVRPTHAYVENETDEKLYGLDTADQTRARAEDDPDTEIRA